MPCAVHFLKKLSNHRFKCFQSKLQLFVNQIIDKQIDIIIKLRQQVLHNTFLLALIHLILCMTLINLCMRRKHVT